MEKLLLQPCTFSSLDDERYKYFLAVSSDKLLVLQKKGETDYEQVEEIVEGIDCQGTLFSCPDEDVFLDAITVIKGILLSGRNPLTEIDW